MSIARIVKFGSNITKITITKSNGETIELPTPISATLTFRGNGSAVVEEFGDRFAGELYSVFCDAESERLRIASLRRIQDFLDIGAISEEQAQRLIDGLETGNNVVIEGDRRAEINCINSGMMTVDDVRQSRFSDRSSTDFEINENSSAAQIRQALELSRAWLMNSNGHSDARYLPYPFKGNPACKFNAQSRVLRCAVNPCGPCEGCTDFESR